MLSRTVSPASHGPLAKLDSTLASTYQLYQLAKNDPANTQTSASGSIEVQAYATVGDRAQLVAGLKKLKATQISGTGREVDSIVPISNLARLAKLPGLRLATTPAYVVNTGTVTSQGDVATIANTGRSTYNISGAGITIGILSDSFNNNLNTSITDTYATDVASNNLPSSVQILSDNVAGTDEGRAIAQVIYDSAPGATLKFATALGGAGQNVLQSQQTMASNILALANAGAKIIVDDVTYNNEPMFQDGVIAQAVQTVIGRGITYISAAGNRGQQSYGSSWRAGTNYSAGAFTTDPTALNAPSTFYAGTSFNFATSGGVNDRQTFTLAAGKKIDLSFQWDSPYFSVSGGAGNTRQVDVYVLNSANKIVGGSVAYVVGGDPIQRITYTNPATSGSATYQLLVVSESTTAPGYIKYVDFAGQATNWGFVASGTDTSTIFGHANANGVIAVGAVNYAQTPAFGTTPPVLEPTSSSGGTSIYYNTSGGRLTTPITRQEPVVVGPDHVSNTFFGTQNTGLSPANYNFSGTSAAAASVAGVAALLLSINTSLTPAQVSSILGATAIHMGSSPNLQSGYGFVQTVPAVAAAVGSVTGTVFSDNNANTVLNSGEAGIANVTVYLDLNNNNALDNGEPRTVTASNGVFNFYNVPTGATTLRGITPPGYLATLDSKAITILGATTISGNNLGYFPVVYGGIGVSYTLQLDATTPANVDILLGSTLTYTAPLSILSSLTFNLSGNNNTLTINTANGNPIPSSSSGGVILNDNATGSGNALIINGTSAVDTVDVNFQATTFNSKLVIASGVQIETINGLGGNDLFTVSGGQPDTESLTFNGSSAAANNVQLTVNDVLPNNGTNTFFNAGTNPGSQNTLTVNTGTYTFAADPAITSSNLTVNVNGSKNPNGTVIFSAGNPGSGINSRNITALNIGVGGDVIVAAPASHADRAVLITNNLSIASGGMLDMDANDAIITSGNISTISALVGSGYGSGSWNSGNGIQSTAASNDPTHLTALGILKNNGSGPPLYGSSRPLGLFDNQSPGGAAILIKYTYYGDTDLTGSIDGTDYSRVDSGFVLAQTGWINGDFNYDNVINGSDYTLLDNAFNTQGPGL